MEPSKLESLPNEVLLHLFEKHINGVDIILAFNHRLNRRFTSLISQLRCISFDFSQCHEKDFQVCLSSLGSYKKIIEKLVLSDRIAPGQIERFLSLYPVFPLFSQLRILSLYFDGESTNSVAISTAIFSVIHTEIERLSIIGKRDFRLQDIRPCMNAIHRVTTLKHLYLNITDGYRWITSAREPSNIKTLTLSDVSGNLHDFEEVCRYGQCAKYIHVQLSPVLSHIHAIPNPISSAGLPIMKHLQTLNLSVGGFSYLNFQRLATCFESMPMLRRFTMKACRNLTDAKEWKHVITTHLPLLTHFTLCIRQTILDKSLEDRLLESFQHQFWIDHPNFHFIIVLHGWLMGLEDQEASIKQDTNIFERPVTNLRIAPQRSNTINSSVIDAFPFLDIIALDKMQISSYRFANVRSLVISTNNVSLFNSLPQRIDCSQVHRVVLKNFPITETDLTNLLQSMKNICSLQIDQRLLLFLTQLYPSVIHLDVALNGHPFDLAVASRIKRTFPSLQHLRLRTSDINCVSKMKIYLEHLNCLEFDRQRVKSSDTSKTATFNGIKSIADKATFIGHSNSHSVKIWLNRENIERLFENDFDVTTTRAELPRVRADTKTKDGHFFSSIFNFLRRSSD